jgi:hypothetical protein
MNFRSKIAALAMIAAFAAPSIALAQAMVTLAKGDNVNLVMESTLDTGTAYVGQRFTARIVPPYPEGDTDLANAVASGEVVKVTPAGQGRNPELLQSFTTITLANGSSYPINAEVTGAGTKQQQKNAGHTVLTTLGGLIAGNIIGKTIFHAATGIGGLIGAAGGFLIGQNKKSNLTLSPGANIQLTLTRPLLVRRQATQP